MPHRHAPLGYRGNMHKNNHLFFLKLKTIIFYARNYLGFLCKFCATTLHFWLELSSDAFQLQSLGDKCETCTLFVYFATSLHPLFYILMYYYVIPYFIFLFCTPSVFQIT